MKMIFTAAIVAILASPGMAQEKDCGEPTELWKLNRFIQVRIEAIDGPQTDWIATASMKPEILVEIRRIDPILAAALEAYDQAKGIRQRAGCSGYFPPSLYE